ncbi:hypothetical protein QN348_08110 [Mucilaginibacter sp. 5C4]|nr:MULTISPECIES: hypothetical protein [unclassified Mucilaginibacter]MEB0300834.1 hypothetical protein [Mucilaginibacter sp. 5C4]WPX25282.1 hypothetical protein RHM67_08400 [Mucilaginibacter sp. 5C4]
MKKQKTTNLALRLSTFASQLAGNDQKQPPDVNANLPVRIQAQAVPTAQKKILGHLMLIWTTCKIRFMSTPFINRGKLHGYC